MATQPKPKQRADKNLIKRTFIISLIIKCLIHHNSRNLIGIIHGNEIHDLSATKCSVGDGLRFEAVYSPPTIPFLLYSILPKRQKQLYQLSWSNMSHHATIHSLFLCHGKLETKAIICHLARRAIVTDYSKWTSSDRMGPRQ